jgi:rubrerythrin
MVLNEEESALLTKTLREHRAKKVSPTKDIDAQLKKVEQEIVDEPDVDNMNQCAECGWQFEGQPEKCPQCSVDLEWSDGTTD